MLRSGNCRPISTTASPWLEEGLVSEAVGEPARSTAEADAAARISTRLEDVRIERGISIAELSRRTNIDKKRLWYVLNGQREMRVEEFLKLCIALRTDPRSFVTREMVDGIAEATARSISRARH